MKTFLLLSGLVLVAVNIPLPVRADQKTPQKPVALAIAEGKPLPPFSAVDAFGQRRQSTQLKGKRALLVTFFPKCFTGNCTSQLQSLRDHYAELQKQGVEVWGISTDPADGPHGQRAFSKHLNLPFPLIPDTSRTLSLLFGAVQTREQMALRMSVFIDNRGIVRSIDKQIDVRTHGADVLRRLPEWKKPPTKLPLHDDTSDESG